MMEHREKIESLVEKASNWKPSDDLESEPTAWPAKVNDKALYGLAGDIVKTIEPHTEADPIAILFQLLVAFGNIVGLNPHFAVEADRHGCNLFIALVGETAKGRKGTSWGYIKRLFSEINADWLINNIAHGLSSGEGLIWAVRDAIVKKEPIKDKKSGEVTGYREYLEDEGVEDKRLLVFESEFASTLRVLSRDGNTLSAVIRNSWDSGNLRTLTKNSPAKATGAHISIIGHITKNELLRYLSSTETANGFANRFLWVCAKRSKVLPEGGHIDEVDFRPIIERLKTAIESAKKVGVIKRDEEARGIWCEVYENLSEGKPGLRGAVIARAEAQVMRLACLYALLDCSNVIKKQHLLAALALWDYSEASSSYIFGDSLGDPIADRIIQALIERKQGLTRTEISFLFKNNKGAAAINSALLLLEKTHLARKVIEKTEGRSIERWLAVKGTKYTKKTK